MRFALVPLFLSLLGAFAREAQSQEDVWKQQAKELSVRAGKLFSARSLAEAAQELEKALDLLEKAYPKAQFPAGHPEIATLLSSLAYVRKELAEYKKAEPRFQQAVEMRRRVLGEMHPLHALSLYSLGELYLAQGQLAQAEPLVRQAMEIQRKVLGEKHQAYLTSLSSLALLYMGQAAYAKAEPLFQQVAQTVREVRGETHVEYATAQGNLALLYQTQGLYAKAEPLQQKAVEILRQAGGEKHPNYVASLNNLALLYNHQGAYTKAEPLYLEAIDIRRKTHGEKHPFFAASLNNLAVLYHNQNAYAKAEPLFRQAMEIQRQAFGEKHPDYATTLYNLSGVCRNQGAHAEAERLLLQTLEIWKQLHGEQHPSYAQSLHQLAFLYDLQGAYEKAELLNQQALETARRMLGEKHPNVARSLNNLAYSHLRRSDLKGAETLGRQAVQIVTEHLEATASVQTEQGQTILLSKYRTFLNNYLSCTATGNTPTSEVYAVVLPWKGAVTNRQRLTRFARTALGDADKETLGLFAKLDDISRQYANLTLRPVQPKTAEDLPKKLRELDAERDRLEIELARRTEAFRRLRQAKQLTPAELQKTLPEGTALIDFLVYPRSDPKAGKMMESLVAFVVSSKQIERVELGPLAPVTQAVDDYLATLKRAQPRAGEKEPAMVLRDKIWQPLAKHVEGAKVVLIAPDGPLCRLPFAALPSTDGAKYLLEEHAISVLPVPQMLPELLAPRKDRPADALPSMLALGDVDFDAVPGLSQKTEEVAWKRRRAGDNLNWSRLPGTKGELLAIEDAFAKAIPKGKLGVLRDAQATEAEFRKQAPKFEYLHLATHGFFAPKDVKSALKSDDKDETGLRTAEEARQRFAGHQPGLLSGVVLAGANNPKDDDDGVLTALEVAELDLTKVELAVLSACETGLGEVAGGEGVLGLQRAFQIAGARTTITSLWKVDDEATRKLMERFYDNYWKKNMGTLEALREAQLWMLREGTQRGIVRLDQQDNSQGRTPPYYWAAFVLSGDWR